MFTADRFNPAALAFPVEMNSVMDAVASRVLVSPIGNRPLDAESAGRLEQSWSTGLQHATRERIPRQTHLQRLPGRATV
jgi:hypothetical protein